VAIAIEHVGSTAVSGLAAKPILDIDVVLRSVTDVGEAIRCLAEFGYQHDGDQGVTGREAFESPGGLPSHHLYVVVQCSEPLRNHIRFRDYLRSQSAAKEYEHLKRSLAEQFRDDCEGYTRGKTAFIQAVLRQSCKTAEV
jgi:GrpB-like predicted nucleotidyltransferase (UPF0157 family)